MLNEILMILSVIAGAAGLGALYVGDYFNSTRAFALGFGLVSASKLVEIWQARVCRRRIAAPAIILEHVKGGGICNNVFLSGKPKT